MKPLLFITSTHFKIKLREKIQDLNQEMNFEEIIDFLMKNILVEIKKTPNNSKRYISLMIDFHGEEEFKKILEYNIKTLGINFSHLEKDKSYISGNSWHKELDLDGQMSWLEWFVFEYLDYDQPDISININEQQMWEDLQEEENN
jgi:hypothetical protein